MRVDFGPNSFLYPMPVLIIAAYDEDGKPCCMNAAWGGICKTNRVGMCVSPGHKTVKNIRAAGEFTVSVGNVQNETACDYVGLVSGNDVPDKMDKAGFHTSKAKNVDAPVIDELPMTLECRVLSYDEEASFLVGEIVNVSADESILGPDGNISPEKLQPICYDPVGHKYHALGEVVGDAFSDGNKLK